MARAEAQIGSSSAGLRFLAFAAALTPLPANAGAWTAPEGGQEIFSSAAGERNDLSYGETSAYWEIPIGDENAFVAAPWVETTYDTDEGYRAEAVVGVKRAIFRNEDSVVAVQAGALWISHPRDDGCSEGGVEARFLGGRSFGDSGFVNAELAGRVLEGGCEGARFDLTAGYRPRENWLALGQVFVDAAPNGEESVKVQLSAVRFSEGGRGIQVGLRARVDGEDLEPALVVSFWGLLSSD